MRVASSARAVVDEVNSSVRDDASEWPSGTRVAACDGDQSTECTLIRTSRSMRCAAAGVASFVCCDGVEDVDAVLVLTCPLSREARSVRPLSRTTTTHDAHDDRAHSGTPRRGYTIGACCIDASARLVSSAVAMRPGLLACAVLLTHPAPRPATAPTKPPPCATLFSVILAMDEAMRKGKSINDERTNERAGV
jgi:hypothetical protein